MAIYSHSKLSTFEQCPLKFKYKYIDKIKPLIKGTIETHLGKAVHSTLEWVYKKAKNKEPPLMDEIIKHYVETWERNYEPEILIVKKELTQADYFNKGVEFLIHYYNKYYPFKDGTIECEKKVEIFLDEKEEYKVIGFIDRLVYNLETKEYEIHDYKTANSLPQKEKIDNDRQLALYSIAVKELFGKDKKIKLIWHYLAYNKKIESKRTDEELKKLKEKTLELIKKIESTKVFPYNKSILCNWCEFKPICPAWKKGNYHNQKEKPLDIW